MIKKFIKEKISKNPAKILLPYTLTRKHIYILPTRYGLLFLIVLGGMLMGSVNYDNNLGFLLTFLLGGMTFVSILYTYKNISQIQVISVISHPCFANKNAVFEFIIHVNSDRQTVIFDLQKGDKISQDIFIAKDNKIKISAFAKKRGIFKPGILTIYTMYPLGLFYAWSKLNLNLRCIVYPSPISGILALTEDETGFSEKDTGKTHTLGVDDFHGLKKYQPGDALQHISWKAFSKGQGVLTKEFIATTGDAVFFDWDTLEKQDTEYRLSRLCGMIMKAYKSGMIFGLKLPGKILKPDRGEAHYHNCLRSLALFGYTLEDE